MIRAEALGELKDGAAGLVTLCELLGSRRVGPKAITAAVGPAGEACAIVAESARALALDVTETARDHAEAAVEIQAIFDRAVAGVRALGAELAAAKGEPGDARLRLVLERATQLATAQVATCLFTAELFAAASSPRTVSIRVADVLAFGPAIAAGPSVIRATLDAPPGPVVSTDARLLRALVELGVQIVAAAGVEAPHIQVTSSSPGGARVRVGAPAPSPVAVSRASFGARRAAREPAVEGSVLSVRRLPWSDRARELARAAGAMTGVAVAADPSGRGLTATFA